MSKLKTSISDLMFFLHRYLDTGISINNKCNINLRLLISALASSVMNKVGPEGPSSDCEIFTNIRLKL